jgi:hypothetical protein
MKAKRNRLSENPILEVVLNLLLSDLRAIFEDYLSEL